MGYLRNRGTKQRPEWYIRYRDVDGKWKQRHSHQTSKEAARALLADIEESAFWRGIQGMVDPTPDELARKSITNEDLGETIPRRRRRDRGLQLAARQRPRRLPGASPDHVLGVVSSTLGNRAATSLTVEDVRRLRDDQLAGGLAPGSVAQTLAFLSRLYTWGKTAGHIDCANPVANCERTHSAEVLDYLSNAEVTSPSILSGRDGSEREQARLVGSSSRCGSR